MEKLEMATKRSQLWGGKTASADQASGCRIFRPGLKIALNMSGWFWASFNAAIALDTSQEQADRHFQLYEI